MSEEKRKLSFVSNEKPQEEVKQETQNNEVISSETLEIMKVDALISIAQSLEKIAEKMCTTQVVNQAIETQNSSVISVASIENVIPEEVKDSITITENTDRFIIKSKKFLGTENFAKLSSAIRNINGRYISAGKESRFEIMK